MRIDHDVIEIEADSFEEFMEKLGEHLKPHMGETREDHAAAKLRLQYEMQSSELAQSLRMQGIDFILSTTKLASAMGAQLMQDAPLVEVERMRDTLHKCINEYFDFARAHFKTPEFAADMEKYRASQGRKDDTLSRAERARRTAETRDVGD